MRSRQNLTISLDPETLRKAKILAAHRNTSVTRLVADLVSQLVADDERYEAARRKAVAYLDEGFAMGGRITASRADWHER